MTDQPPRCRSSGQQHFENVCRNFDARDSKGRVIGARASLWEVDFTLIPESEARDLRFGFVRHEPGHFFAFEPHALRDGAAYGSSHGYKTFSSREDRDVAVARYFREAEKRAARAAAK